MKIAFFGTPQFAVTILDELKKAGIVPALVVTAPDKPAGRKLVITPPPAKVWAEAKGVRVLQPKTLKDAAALSLFLCEDCLSEASSAAKKGESAAACSHWDLFIVAAYGKIMPQDILDIPKHGTLNVHPSLLPLYRGPSPIEGQILNGEDIVGVTIMQLDAELDHGPIVAQESLPMPRGARHNPGGGWDLPRGSELEDLLAHRGGALLASVIPQWLNGDIEAQEQEHSLATFTKKISKEDGLLDLAADPLMNFRKIRAYDPWPGAYFFVEKKHPPKADQSQKPGKIRVVVKDAEFRDGMLTITRVVPEGKREMDYDQFLGN